MNNEQKLLNLLGLAQRAGKVISGEGMVVEAIRSQKTPYLVLIASDAGANTKKKVQDKSHYYHVPCALFATSLQLSQALGKKRIVIAITDAGFAKKMKQLLNY